MTALLALASAVMIGGADFVGALAARRAPAAVVAACAQGIGLAVAIPLALVWTWKVVTTADVLFSLGAGACVGVGLALFYGAMKIGLISLVAPVAAVTGASLPVCVGLARGERPGAVAIVGIVVALAAIAAVSVAPGDVSVISDGASARVFALSIAAGLLFGTFFVLLAEVDEDAGMWPAALIRVGSFAMLAVVVLAMRSSLRTAGSVARYATAVGVLEVVATVPLLLALQRGPVSVAAVFASLYPVPTVLLAAGVLHERLTRPQLAGVGLALLAVVLVSTG